MRPFPAPHSGAPVGAAADYLAWWKCDDIAGANVADTMAVRTLTQTGAPGAATSLYGNTTGVLGSGARTFDGATQYAGRTADGDEALFQSMVWGLNLWVQPAVIQIQRFIEYGEHSSAGAGVSNVQIQIFMSSSTVIGIRQQTTAGGFVDSLITVPAISAGDVFAIGVTAELDPDNFGQQRLRVYFNGDCVGIFGGLAPPDGGSAARWILGASRRQGSAVNAPGSFLNGSIDDVVVTKFSPTHEWFREVYARGKRDFLMRAGPSGDPNLETVITETYARVLVEVGASSFTAFDDKVNLTDLDLSSINGIDFLQSIEWGENVDDAGATATIRMFPRFGFYNMSPFVPSAGALNDNPLDGLWNVPRRVKIEIAEVPCGTCREGVGSNWWLVFEGWTLAVDVSADSVTLTAIDKIGPLQEVWIQSAEDGTDRVYGSAGGVDIEAVLQQMIDDSDPARYDIVSIDDTGAGGKLQAIVLDTTVEKGNGRPHLLQSGDQVQVEGTVNFNGIYHLDGGTTATMLQTLETHGAAALESVGLVRALPALSYLGGKPTIVTPASPSYKLFTNNEPASKSVAQAMEDLLDATIGWRCVFRWDDVRFAYRLKIYDPRSSYGSINRCADNIMPPGRMAMRRDDQRDVGVVEYGKNTSKDNVGERTPFIVTARAVAERAGGYRAFRFSVGSDSLVTDSTAAQKLADALVGDLKKATAESDLEVLYDPSFEPHDEVVLTSEVLTATQMATMFGDQVVAAVAELRHQVSEGAIRTSIRFRKLQLGGALDASIARGSRHLQLINMRGSIPGIGRSPIATPAAPTVSSYGATLTPRTFAASWPMPAGDGARAWTHTEIHVSTGTGFTPSSATLKAVVAGTFATIAHGVTGGVTGFVKIIHRDRMGNRSAASAQTSFVS